MQIIFSLIFRGVIVLYQKILSPLLAPTCRYTPTCSQYALESIIKHGPWQGGRLTIRRIFNCHPWGGAGHDPVP